MKTEIRKQKYKNRHMGIWSEREGKQRGAKYYI